MYTCDSSHLQLSYATAQGIVNY